MASSQFTLPEGFSGFADADFSGVILTAGQQYTVLIAAPDYDWVVSWNQFADDNGPIPGRIDYAGSSAILSGSALPNNDLTFQVQPIPEIVGQTRHEVRGAGRASAGGRGADLRDDGRAAARAREPAAGMGRTVGTASVRRLMRASYLRFSGQAGRTYQQTGRSQKEQGTV